MKRLLLIPFFACGVISCSNPAKAEEFDRKNLFQTEFFYERGFTGRAMMHAKRIKKSSPRYQEAQEWIRRIEEESAATQFEE